MSWAPRAPTHARGLDEEVVVDAGQQRAVGARCEPRFELRQADEDDGPQGPHVPRGVEQDVEVAEHVGV